MTEPLEAFRARCRAFLAEPVERLGDDWATAAAFQRRLADAGLAGLSVPVAYGGQGLGPEHLEVFAEEAAGRDLPLGTFTITLGMCVPVLLRHGTEAQRRAHLPAMLRGEQIWCQLFSEPNAGSDVAAAQLRAVRDGDEWVLDGQKVWTSSAQRAAYGMCIARTDPDVPKHRGLTMFAVPMAAPGITVRPLVQATGEAHFNEVFFDGARIPADAVIGEPGAGWAVTISMLMNERASLGASTGSLLAGRTAPVLAEGRARAQGADGLDELARLELAALHEGEEVQRHLALRVRAAAEAGRDPGPGGSVGKLLASALVRRAAEAHVALRGPAGVAWEQDDAEAAAVARELVSAPSLSIAGGTSEIQRTILGERVLGLPKEPEVDKGVPFRQVRQNPGR